MHRTRLYLWTVLLVLICVAFPSTGVLAQDDEAFIQYRQKVMQANGGHMGAIGAIMKNKLPYEKAIAVHALAIQMTSRVIAEAFEKKITAGKTDAKPDIWKDWDKFVAAAKKLGEESGKLARIVQSGDMAAIGAQVKAVGQACGDCHKPFRKPKEESYKRGM